MSASPMFEKDFKPARERLPNVIPPDWWPSDEATPAHIEEAESAGWDREVAAGLRAAKAAQVAADDAAAEEEWRAAFVASSLAQGYTAEAAQAQLDDVLERRAVQAAHLERRAEGGGGMHVVQPTPPWAIASVPDPVEALRAEVAELKAMVAELTGSVQ